MSVIPRSEYRQIHKPRGSNYCANSFPRIDPPYDGSQTQTRKNNRKAHAANDGWDPFGTKPGKPTQRAR